MSQYKFIVPAFTANPPASTEELEYTMIEDFKADSTDLVDTHYNPLTLSSLYTNLHSILQNDFYKPFMDVFLEETQQLIESSYKLEKTFDLFTYLGNETEYGERISNLTRILNLKAPSELLKYLQTNYFPTSDFSVDLSLYPKFLKNKWKRDFIYSSFIMRKWFGSLPGYQYIFNSMYKVGNITVLNTYPQTSLFSYLTEKIYKFNYFFAIPSLLTKNPFYKNIPSTDVSIWPVSRNFNGLTSLLNLTSTIMLKYDTEKLYDEDLTYDTNELTELNATFLCLEISLDTILTHTNPLATNECLLDNFFLSYISTLLPNVKKLSENCIIGSQLSLVASNTGQYITDPLVQVVDENGTDVFYTHPNIKAKFQVIKSKWDADPSVTFIRVGEGSYGSTVLATHLEDPLLKNDPSNIDLPVFESILGTNEVNSINNYLAVSTIFRKQVFSNKEMISVSFNIGKTLESEGNVLTTVVQLPHRNITKGSCSFNIPFEFYREDGTLEQRTLVIKERFNSDILVKDFIPFVYELDNFNNRITINTINALDGFMEDSLYSNDTNYLDNKDLNIFTLFEVEELYGNPSYVKIDHLLGTITLKMKFNPNSKASYLNSAYGGTGNISDTSSVFCSYAINSSNKKQGEVTKITEIGLFNSTGDMVAYGEFPPILYNADNYHLSVNCFLEKPV